MTRPSPRHRAGGAGDGLQKGCASRPPFEETSGVTQGSGKAPEARGNGVASSATKGSARCRGEGVTRQRASRGAHPVRGRVDQIGKGKARTRSETQYLEKPEIMVPGGGIEPPTRGFSIHCSTPELPGHGSPLSRSGERVLGPVARGVQPHFAPKPTSFHETQIILS